MARRGEKQHVVPINDYHGAEASPGNWHDDDLVSSYLDDQSQLYFKVLVAGEVGIGKTTLAATLANTLQGKCYIPDTVEFDESQRFVLTFPSGARPRTVICTMVDTPASTGNDRNLQSDLDRIKNYVETCIERYWNTLEPDRLVAGVGTLHPGSASANGLLPELLGDVDNRVDLVLYLLPPRRLSVSDREALQQFSELASVIPVVARADTLTPAERTTCRERLCQDLAQVGLPLVEPCLQGPNGFLAAHTCDLPLIVGSGQQLEGGQPIRHYPWGSFKATLPEQSDLELLRALVFAEPTVLTLKHQTEMRFASYRRREAAAEQQRRREGGLEGPFTCNVVVRLTFFLLASLLLLLSGFLLLQALSPSSFALPARRASFHEAGGVSLEEASGADEVDDGGDQSGDSEDVAEELWGRDDYQLVLLDRIDHTTGSMQEVVMTPPARYVVLAVAPHLVGRRDRNTSEAL
eukprot:CAMPEP_0118950664 /NCGR_PEP_ID=MMETSP1169-20130426/51790_1 /TAXON_ID=36882 /ORGANISM="Pyramimonas obovata, Strain CCMP722" /LENGTH=464 /DNA_ID=CAMNT_0006897553 /DNA_START=236 /DNA_END=1627 /DNA_ORIENTATION=+